MKDSVLTVCWLHWCFWLRVLFLSVCCSPIVCGQVLPPLPTLPLVSPVEQFEAPDANQFLPAPETFALPAPEPATPELEPTPEMIPEYRETAYAVDPAAQGPFIGDHCAPNYWIVSSRCSVQHKNAVGRWGLDVIQRHPDGQMMSSDLATLSAQIVPGIPVCIFSHGSFVKWESQCREAEGAYRAMRSACPNQPVQMIFFTWPSDGPYTHILPVDASIRGERAEFNGFHMSYLISQLPESCPVCLIGHSHGTRVMLSTLHLAGGGEIQGHVFTGNIGNRRIRTVLAAAATDHYWLNPGRRYGCALTRTEALLNLQNRADFPLAFYGLSHPFAGAALARSGFTNRDLRRIGCNSDKIVECDVTSLIGPDHLWPEYFEKPEVISAMVPYIYFQ